MKYFFLRHEYSDSGYIDGDVTFIPSMESYYQVGASMPIEGRVVSVVMDKAVRKLKVDFFLTTSGAFFASEELATLIKLFQGDVQTLPAETRYFNGKGTEKKYRLVHANGKLACFDYYRSTYAGKPLVLQRLERGERPEDFLVKGIQSLAIDEGRARDAHFFFVKDVVLIDPIVSEALAGGMRARGLNVRLEGLMS